MNSATQNTASNTLTVQFLDGSFPGHPVDCQNETIADAVGMIETLVLDAEAGRFDSSWPTDRAAYRIVDGNEEIITPSQSEQIAGRTCGRRAAADLTQEVAANLAGITTQQWSRIERAGRGDIATSTLKRVAAALLCTMDDLAG